MPTQVTRISIFVASPGDVQAERDALDEVVEDLNRILGDEKQIVLELKRWETHAYPAMGRVQAVINQQVEPYDIFVGLFWKRFGTPTATADSGTEGSGCEAVGGGESSSGICSAAGAVGGADSAMGGAVKLRAAARTREPSSESPQVGSDRARTRTSRWQLRR